MLISNPKHHILFIYQGKVIFFFFVWTHQNGRFGLDFFFFKLPGKAGLYSSLQASWTSFQIKYCNFGMEMFEYLNVRVKLNKYSLFSNAWCLA